jgi:predicted dehydrogenase
VKEAALLENDKVQVVYIETDPSESLKPALRSVMAGKHTKIDKPPGADLKALEKIFEEAVRRHCLVQMGYVYRYNPAFRLAHRVLKEKWLGPIRSVVCQMNDKKLSPEYPRYLEDDSCPIPSEEQQPWARSEAWARLRWPRTSH